MVECSTTTDSIQTGRSLDQGTAALAETQKQIEALKAYRDAKKIELAKGVYGVTQDDVTKADIALNKALGTAQQIQLQIENFRPKTESETKPPAAKLTSNANATTLLASASKFNAAGYDSPAATLAGVKRGDKKAQAVFEELIKRGDTTPAQRQEFEKWKAFEKWKVR